MQRFEELKFLLSMEEDPLKRKECLETIRLHLAKKLETVDLCDTSSDEDETREPVSDVTRSSIDTSNREVAKNPKRLPGVIEKWNSDVSDEEDDKEASNENEEENDNDQYSERSDDEEDNNDEGKDSDSGEEPENNNLAIVSTSGSSLTQLRHTFHCR
jgi:TATA-binding protein-associated factor Taf7